MSNDDRLAEEAARAEDRRAFLKRCSRFAAVTPPAFTLLLSVASIPEEAHASTIGNGNGKKKGWLKKGGPNSD
jgi:hypothetical protein